MATSLWQSFEKTNKFTFKYLLRKALGKGILSGRPLQLLFIV
jgi:hypothetical protein